MSRPAHIAFAAALALAWPAPSPAQDPGEAVAVPSGQEVRFVEMLRDAGGASGPTIRFRFVAPAIARDGGAVDFDTAAADMEHICREFVLPRLSGEAAVGQVVISMSDRPVAFGQPAPEATQYFEAFSVQDGDCVWEGL